MRTAMSTIAAPVQVKESTVHAHFASDPFAEPQGMRPGSDLDFHLRPAVQRHIRRTWNPARHPEVPELEVEGYRFRFLYLKATITRTHLSRTFRVYYWRR